MREKLIFLFSCEIAAFGLCAAGAASSLERAAPFALLIGCILGLKLLFGLLGLPAPVLYGLLLSAVIVTYFVFGFSPYAALVAVFAAYGVSLFWRMKNKDDISLKILEENETLRDRLARQKMGTQNAEHLARLRERNRIALRLHDKIGHGISGSVLLLEGAALYLEKNPDMAKAAITAATENLRNTVDEIRGILTEERAANAGIGRTELADKLLKFGSLYPKIKTEFTAENTEGVTPDIWRCLSDNLTEALTNLIKHSDATAFSVSIHCDPWLVKAVFADNGTANTHKKGTGLAGMEERAAFCGGRCFFRTDHGFTITMVFTIGAKEDVST